MCVLTRQTQCRTTASLLLPTQTPTITPFTIRLWIYLTWEMSFPLCRKCICACVCVAYRTFGRYRKPKKKKKSPVLRCVLPVCVCVCAIIEPPTHTTNQPTKKEQNRNQNFLERAHSTHRAPRPRLTDVFVHNFDTNS